MDEVGYLGLSEVRNAQLDLPLQGEDERRVRLMADGNVDGLEKSVSSNSSCQQQLVITGDSW